MLQINWRAGSHRFGHYNGVSVHGVMYSDNYLVVNCIYILRFCDFKFSI